MRVFLVNRYFWPDESATSQLLTDLAEDLGAAGHEVHVFTSRQLYNQPRTRLPQQQTWQGIHIHRLQASHFGRRRFWGRLVDIITFHLALRYGNQIPAGPDAWFVMTDPPLIAATVLHLRRTLGGRVIHHVDDVYPDLALAMGSLPLRGPAAALLERVARASLQNCDQVVALGECMAGVLKAKGVPEDRLAVAPPWADGRRLQPLDHADNEFRRELGIPGEDLVVMYSGNMGQGHRFETMLEAARSLAPDPGVHFAFIGDGARRQQIDAFRTSHQLKNILMLPSQPRERLRQILAAGDVHLVSLDARVQGLIVPSKLAGILAVGRPVIFLGSEQNSVAAAIHRGRCGCVIPEGEAGKLVSAIRDLGNSPEYRKRLGHSGRKLFEREFDRAVVVPRIISKIEGVAAQGANP